MKKLIDAVAQTVTYQFEDGLDPIVQRLKDAHESNQIYAALHGMAARCGDKAAIQKSAENNFKVTEAMRRAAVAEMVDHYKSGTEAWELKAGPRAAPLNPHIQAIAEKRNCSYTEAMAWFNAKLMAELNDE